MCDPITLTIAATAVAATGKLVSGIGQAQQANYAATVADQNAKAAANQANVNETNTQTEAQRRYRALSQTQGNQQAALAANGVDINFGTSVDLQRDTAMIGAEDVGQIYRAGADRTRNLDIQGQNYHAQANADRAKASGAIIGGIFDAAGTALGGASQVSSMNAKLPKPNFGGGY